MSHLSQNPLKVKRVVDQLVKIARENDGLIDVDLIGHLPKERGGRSSTSARAYLRAGVKLGVFTEDTSCDPFLYQLVEPELAEPAGPQQLDMNLDPTYPFADRSPWTMEPMATTKGTANMFAAIHGYYKVRTGRTMADGEVFSAVVRLAGASITKLDGVSLTQFFDTRRRS